MPIDDIQTSYSIGLEAKDETGVLAAIARIFAEHGVSIEAMRQTTHPADAGQTDSATLRFITHTGRESALAATVEDVRRLPVVREITSVLRVEGN